MIHSYPIGEINFYDKPAACISAFKSASWSKKISSFILSFGTLFAFGLTKAYSIFCSKDPKIESLIDVEVNTLVKKKLVVLVHGLNSTPYQLKKVVEEIQLKKPLDTDIFMPRVLGAGNAKLDEMVKPIFDTISAWASTTDDKELVLVGVSNGGRIIRALQAEIAKKGNQGNIKKLKFISIVGACKGSSLVNLANSLGLSFLMSKNISEEMPVNSSRNQKLDIDSDNFPDAKFESKYTFIASPHDWQVLNYSSSLMEIKNSTAQYGLVPNHGHISIVNAVAKEVAEIVVNN